MKKFLNPNRHLVLLRMKLLNDFLCQCYSWESLFTPAILRSTPFYYFIM